MKTLLFIGAGIETVPGIILAKEMGLRVLAADGNPRAPGFALCDDCLVVSIYDTESTYNQVANYHQQSNSVDGVICIGCDASRAVARIATRLGLPGISERSAQLATDKLAMKNKLASDGISVPWFAPVENEHELHRVVKNKGFPLVLKPVDSRGSRGVLRLTSQVDLNWAYSIAQSHSPTKRVMIEQYLDGPQLSTETLMINTIAHTPGMADRNYEFLDLYAPYIIENGGQLPTCLNESQKQAVGNLVEQGALSLGIKNGVVKGDIAFSQGSPYIIELAARMSGGFFCTHEIPWSTGVELVRQAIRLALGDPPSGADLTPRAHRGVAQRWIFSTPGIIQSIQGVEEARRQEGIIDIIIRAKPGDLVLPPSDSNAALGVVMAVGETRELAVQRAEQAVGSIVVETKKREQS